MTKRFPEGFLWGAATAAHQVEGDTDNDWSVWEHLHAERLAREAREHAARDAARPHTIGQVALGRGSVLLPPDAFEERNYRSNRACAHYTRYEEDFDCARSLGHNAHRFSLEWSRIEPREGVFNEEAIEHYRNVLKALRARGLEPFVTLWHWTMPHWMAAMGGAESPQFAAKFERYARVVARRLGGEMSFVMTLNEPTSHLVNGYVRGVWPPQVRSWLRAARAARHLARAHEAAYRALKEELPALRVGFGHIVSAVEPASRGPLDRLAAWARNFIANDAFELLVRPETRDYHAVQYYFHERVAWPQRIVNENRTVSDMGWEIYPEGLYRVLMREKGRGVPVYVTENGVADAEDRLRAEFIRGHLAAVHGAITDGVDVRGYFYWSLLDNFEWDKGFWPRFGLVAVDRTTLARTVRPSAKTYEAIIRANALP